VLHIEVNKEYARQHPLSTELDRYVVYNLQDADPVAFHDRFSRLIVSSSWWKAH